MAIQAPQFHVAALSPAALLQGRQRGGPFQDLLGEIVGITLRGRLQEQAFEREAGLRRELAEGQTEAQMRLEEMRQAGRETVETLDALQRGELRRPGEDTPEGIERLDSPLGELVRTEDVRRAQPFELEGRNVLEGTTRGDVVDPGTGQLSPTLMAEHIEADAEATQEVIDAIPVQAVREAAQSMFDSMVEDGFFSAGELAELQLGPKDMAGYAQVARAMSSLERQDRARLGNLKLSLMTKYQVRDPSAPNGRRNFSPAEADRLGLFLGGYADRLSSEDIEQIHNLDLLRSVDVPDKVAEMQQAYTNATTAAGIPAFTQWISGMVFGENDEPVNERMAEIISKGIPGELSPSAIRVWARDPAATAPYRAAYAAHVAGYTTASSYADYLRGAGVTPFGAQAPLQGYMDLDRGWIDDDADARYIDGGRTARPRPTGGTGADLEDVEAEVESEFGPMRSALSQAFSGVGFRQRSELETLLTSDDPEVVSRELQSRAQALAQQDDETAQSLAALFESMSDSVMSNPRFYQFQVDSILLPALRQQR